MKTLPDTGAVVKEYESQRNEVDQAVQMVITSVASEDPRYIERLSVPLHEEFPVDTDVFFLGERAYGTSARIAGATDKALSVVVTVSGFLRVSIGFQLSFIQL